MPAGKATYVAAAVLAALVMAACGEKPEESTAVISAPKSPSASPVHLPPAHAVKGLADNPAFQWWRLPTGPQPDSWWGTGQTRATLATQTSLMQKLGVKLFRVELVWAFVEPTRPGGSSYDSQLARDSNWTGYRWDRWDMIVDAATAAGIEVVPEIYYTPGWAEGGLPFSVNGGPNYPPKSAAYFGDFIFAVVSRYHDKIHFWEMWNEPDYFPRAWDSTFQDYVALILKPGYESAKAADPHAQVILAGLAGDTKMKAMYDAGAGPYFDIANFHAYYSASQGISTALDHVRGAMNAQGDRAKPVWLTEFGFATQAADTPTQATQPSLSLEASQARLIRDVYAGVKADAIFYYELHDTAVYGPNGPIKFVYWGLVSRDFSQTKPGLDAYMQAPSSELPNNAG